MSVRSYQHDPGGGTPWHHHHEAELVWTHAGALRVSTPRGVWVVPPQRAVWLPPGQAHEVKMCGAGAEHAFFFDRVAGLPDVCCAVAVPEAMRAQLLCAVQDGGGSSHARALASQIVDARLAALPDPFARFSPLQPLSPLRPVADALRLAPGNDRTLADWARVLRVTPRTFARQCEREVGVPFGAWRKQARVLHAVERLAQGISSQQIAKELGYDSPSMFTSMFRRSVGTPPTRYFSD